MDQQIIALYARGLTMRDIQAQLQEIYGVEVSAGLISEVTDEVLDEVKIWQSRPLENMYPVIFLDALMVKMRHDGRIENRAVYVACGTSVGKAGAERGRVGGRMQPVGNIEKYRTFTDAEYF